ncbi:amino acid synthesis family protein [Enteractinococcus coprophilus]|uniref:Amino acid synthesis protein n=1 Tax=Enteractinococcus coprophilus TaxID=1027633 RepID=A0A543AMR7_9MICC|nr:amino acid synthesis family protein [Enteractinococcus coprophilus]TQL73872.1 amino acid synthesis protein [Enteractinococcus coprophilus]
MAKIAKTLDEISVRTIRTVVEEVHSEGGSAASSPRKIAASYAVLKNPWLHEGTAASLTDFAAYAAPILAQEITSRLLEHLGDANDVEAFGKAAVVGLNGEIEHGGAFIHTPFFGNIFREILGGTSIICFSESRAEPSDSLRVPLWHKTEAATRDYYQSLEIQLPDAPHADEIVVMGLASDGPRPHPRIGDRATDPTVTLDIFQGE